MAATTKQAKNKKSKRTAIAERRERVIRLYCSGVSQSDIAAIEEVTQATISGDISQQRLQWQAESMVNFDEKVSREIDKIDELERVANEQLLKSCQDAEEVNSRIEKALREKEATKAQTSSGKKKTLAEALSSGNSVEELVVVKEVTTRKVKGQSGNQAWASTIAWCIETRLRLLGLLKNDPPKPADTVINFNWNSVVQQLPAEGQPLPDRAADAIKALENKHAQDPLRAAQDVPAGALPVGQLSDPVPIPLQPR